MNTILDKLSCVKLTHCETYLAKWIHSNGRCVVINKDIMYWNTMKTLIDNFTKLTSNEDGKYKITIETCVDKE